LTLFREIIGLVFLLLYPSSRSTDRYEIEFSKKGGTIDSLLSAISRSANCTEREASECILKSLYKKQDEAFTSVALEKGLLVDTKKKNGCSTSRSNVI
jgi:hypothetical protein